MERENIAAEMPPEYKDHKSDIALLIQSKLTPVALREKLEDYHANDIAAALSLLSPEQRARLYSILDTDTLSGILEYADDQLNVYLGELGLKKRVSILSHFDAAIALEYLEQIDKRERNTIIELLDDETQKEVLLLRSFDKDEIGSKMSTNYIHIQSNTDVRGAMSQLVTQAADNDNVSTIYVVDAKGCFVGAIDLKDLIRARVTTPLDEIIMKSYPYVYANEATDECIERIREYSEDSIPVLDKDSKLVGALTAQDIADLIEEEIGDDYAKLGGLIAEEELNEPLKRSVGKRLPWLAALLGLGLVVSAVVGLFERVVSELTLIVSFQSLILGMAGNVGTQSLTVTIRSLMDESLDAQKKLKLVFKEVRVGLLNGLILGSASFILIGLFLFIVKGVPPFTAFSVSMCTGIALAVSMLLSALSGSTIPMLFNKLKIDPAIASGPFITTVNDLVAIVTYYGIAWLLLINVLQF